MTAPDFPTELTHADVPATLVARMTITTDTEWTFAGELVRKLRKGRGLSQMAVAAGAGLSLNTVGMVERDELDPKTSTIAALASMLQVEPTAFFRSSR